jgi:hypothetical protein
MESGEAAFGPTRGASAVVRASPLSINEKGDIPTKET